MILGSKSDVTASSGGIAASTHGAQSDINIYNMLSQLPSVLNPLLEGIMDNYDPFSDDDKDEAILNVETENKIDFNSLNVYANVIRENSGLMTLIEEVIDNIDNEKPNSRKRFLGAIHQKYKKVKNELLIRNKTNASDKEQVLELIKENSDNIIHSVTNELSSTTSVNNIGHPNYSIENLEVSRELIVCYGFINCKILEKPNDH